MAALIVAGLQINIQASIEARRGKIDKLAIGDWAVSWPQSQLIVYYIFRIFCIRSPLGDPLALVVPWITGGTLQDYLRMEGSSKRRPREIVSSL